MVVLEPNHGRFERRALVARAIAPTQLGLAGAAQIGRLHRRLSPSANTEIEYLVTSRPVPQLPLEDLLNMDRNYWGVESGCHQRLDCSAFEDRLRIRHKGALHILGLFSRVGIACSSVGLASSPACEIGPTPSGGSGTPAIAGT